MRSRDLRGTICIVLGPSWTFCVHPGPLTNLLCGTWSTWELLVRSRVLTGYFHVFPSYGKFSCCPRSFWDTYMRSCVLMWTFHAVSYPYNSFLNDPGSLQKLVVRSWLLMWAFAWWLVLTGDFPAVQSPDWNSLCSPGCSQERSVQSQVLTGTFLGPYRSSSCSPKSLRELSM